MNIQLKYEAELNDGLDFIRRSIDDSQFAAAIRKSLDMLKVYVDNETILLELAKAYFFSGNYQQSKDIFGSLLKSQNKHAYVFLAMIAKSENNFTDAQKYLEQVNSLFPEDTEIIVNLIDVYKLLGKTEEAEKIIHNINIQSVIGEPNINHMLIRTFRIMNLVSSANKIGEEILAKDPGNIRVIIELAYNNIHIKRFEKAEYLLKKINTDNMDALFAWSELYKAKNDIGKYKKITKKILRKDKYHIGLELSLANMYSLNKQYKKSITILKYLIKKYPQEKHTIQSILCQQYRESGNKKELLSLSMQIFETNNNDKGLFLEIIDICMQSDKFIEALKTIFNFRNDDNIELEQIKDRVYAKLLEYIHDKNIKGYKVEVYMLAAKCCKIIPVNEIKIRNALMNEKEITADRIFLHSKPRRMQVILTNKCNLQCIMCNVHETEWSFSEQKAKELKELMPYLEHLVWQGGEVFLHKDFGDLLETAFKNKVNQTIITNGLLITDEIAERLVKYGVKLAVSIDYIEKEGYEKIRRNGSFEQLVTNLKTLNKMQDRYRNKDFDMKMSVVVMKSNYDKLYDILEFARKYKFNSIELNPIQLRTANTEEQMFFINIDYPKIRHLNMLIPELTEQARKYGIKIISAIPSESVAENMLQETKQFNITKAQINEYIVGGKKNINPLLANKIKIPNQKYVPFKEGINKTLLLQLFVKQFLYFIRSKFYKKTPGKYCFVPWESMFVDLNGYIMPGCNCFLYYYDTIKNNSILDIWNSKSMQIYRANIVNKEYKNICTQQCIHGTITVDKRLYL